MLCDPRSSIIGLERNAFPHGPLCGATRQAEALGAASPPVTLAAVGGKRAQRRTRWGGGGKNTTRERQSGAASGLDQLRARRLMSMEDMHGHGGEEKGDRPEPVRGALIISASVGQRRAGVG